MGECILGFDNCADMVLFDGKVITVDGHNSVAEAVAARDGKIIKVGASEDIKAFAVEKTKVIDLKGRTVVPGIIDVHFHLSWLASTSRLDLNVGIPPLSSVEDIKGAIRKRVQETRKREWIIAHGRANLQTYPSKEEIDELAPENPMIINISGHRQLLNAKALELAAGGKITKNSPTEEELRKLAPGGRIQRDPKTGEPTGVLDDAWNYVFLSRSPYPYEKLKEAVKKTCRELVQHGITSIHDLGGWSVSRWIYQDLLRDGELPLRIQFLPNIWDSNTTDMDWLLQLGLKSGFGNEWIKFGGIKIFVDAQKIPEYTKMRLTREKLIDLLIKANKGGMRAVMHAVTREGTKMAIDAIETALKQMPVKDHRHRIDHFGSHSLVSHEDIERVESLGIIPGPQMYCVYYGESIMTEKGQAYLFKGMMRDTGEKEESLLGPFIFGHLMHKGLKVPGSSDATQSEIANPWWNIWCAVNRKNYKGELVFPEDKITMMEGIRAYTINSAYAGFEEGIKGSIEEGKLADLVILAEDPLTISADRIKDIKVDMTVVGGRIVYCRKQGC